MTTSSAWRRCLCVLLPLATLASAVPVQLVANTAATAGDAFIPQEIHLTLGHDHRHMAVSWADVGMPSPNVTLTSHVTFGTDPSALDRTANSTPTVLVSAGEGPPYTPSTFCTGPDQVHTFHSVTLTDLEPDTEYYYYAFVLLHGTHVRSQRSATYRFRSAPAPQSSAASALHFFAVADMGDPVSHNWVAIPEMARLSANRTCSSSAQGAAAESTGPPLEAVWDAPVSLGVHVGDIAYDLNLGPRGDDYMKGVSSMASTYPWMFMAGNHEADCNFSYANYNNRYAAQNHTASSQSVASGSSRYYSFDLGPVHFVAIDTDGYAFGEVAYVLPPMYDWLSADLEAVDREVTPWVVLMGHRPMYCTSLTSTLTSHLGWPLQPDELIQPGKPPPPEPAGYGDKFRALGLEPPPWLFLDPQMKDWPNSLGSMHDPTTQEVYDCGVAELIRNGMVSTKDGSRLFAIEPLMAKHGVDIYLTGHEHNYERTFPVLNGTVIQTADPHSFHRPKAPIHVLTGAGGAYSHDMFGPPANYDAFRTLEWSFSDIVVNRTHLGLKQRLASNGTTIDEFVISR